MSRKNRGGLRMRTNYTLGCGDALPGPLGIRYTGLDKSGEYICLQKGSGGSR